MRNIAHCNLTTQEYGVTVLDADLNDIEVRFVLPDELVELSKTETIKILKTDQNGTAATVGEFSNLETNEISVDFAENYGVGEVQYNVKATNYTSETIKFNAAEVLNAEADNIYIDYIDGVFKIKKTSSRAENVVYETTLEKATNTIEATGLDMVRDGGKYEFELIHAGSDAGGIEITFNGINTGYYQQGVSYNGALTANGELSSTPFFRKAMSSIYYALDETNTMQFPAITKGEILFSNLTRKTVCYELKNVIVLSGKQQVTELYGLNDQAIENLTSVKFAKTNNANFLAGTRLKIRKTA